MAYENRNRGPRPGDEACFGPAACLSLSAAADDYGYLQTRGYGKAASTKAVGDRYSLNTRQRTALQRIAASEQEIAKRKKQEVPISKLKEKSIAIDGFNLLITLESALSGGYIFQCRDGAYRDMASISGSYKRVRQTQQSIEAVADLLLKVQATAIIWYLDQPVSNSGKLAALIREVGLQKAINWEVELHPDPDGKIISLVDTIAISSDSRVMDESAQWSNITAALLESMEQVNLVVV